VVFVAPLRPRRLLVAGALLLLAGCAKRESPADAAVRTQTLLCGNAAEPADLDPHTIYALTDSQIGYALFEGLTILDALDGSRPRPGAAQSWDVSPDGTVYTFHLRPTGRWSNGDPVTAQDFVYSAHRILSPALAANYSYMLWPVKNAEAFNTGKVTDFSQVGVKALDPLTVQYTLTNPTPYFPALVSHTTWLPVHQATIEQFGAIDQKGTKWTRPGNLVGNGAFRLVEWVPDSRIAVERNARYWDDAHTKLHRIEFYPFEKPDIEELNYRSGQLQTTYALPVSKFDEYRKSGELAIDPVLAVYYLFFNTAKPPFDNVKLRLALAHALNREQICRDITKGVYPPAHNMVPPNCGGYTSRSGLTDDFDLARKLLAEAGYPGGQGLPSIEIQCYESEVPLKTLEALQAMWHTELGVRVTIGQLEQKTLFANQQQGAYAIAFSGWVADYPDPLTFLETAETGNGNNWSKWSNPRFDALVEETRHMADNARRLELFQQAEAIMMSEAPILPLYFRPQVYAKQPVVKGWTTTVAGFHEFNKVWLEK